MPEVFTMSANVSAPCLQSLQLGRILGMEGRLTPSQTGCDRRPGRYPYEGDIRNREVRVSTRAEVDKLFAIGFPSLVTTVCINCIQYPAFIAAEGAKPEC